jgi:ribosome-associated protein
MKCTTEPVSEFSLDGRAYIALHALLKVEGWCPSGAAAKHTIDTGNVCVDGKIELRRRCKVLAGQVVGMDGNKVLVTA